MDKTATDVSTLDTHIGDAAWSPTSVVVIGAGNGGKACAADLAIQGVRVTLADFAEFATLNFDGLDTACPVLTVSGAIEGTAQLAAITTDLHAAVRASDAIIVCTVSNAHARVAHALAPVLTPNHVVILNPGSTGGALHLATIWRREHAMQTLPTVVEFGTLTYGCRANGAAVSVSVKARRVAYGALPATAMPRVAPTLERWFPGLVPAPSVLAAGLTNANPVIHPAITLLNLGRMEQQGSAMLFYRDGVSPMVAHLIQALDEERMALMRALGYDAMSDVENSVLQGYADAASSYYECYGKGTVYGTFACPDGASLATHRYLYEDCGQGLVLYCSLGRALGVPTPVSAAVVQIASVVAQHDFVAAQARTVGTLGMDGMGREAMVVATALVFLHDVHARDIHAYIDDGQRRAQACIFLAAKAEEAGLRTNDLINTVALAWPLCAGDDWAMPARGALDAAVASFAPIIADAYSACKQTLLMDEQVTLRLLQFQLCIQHPYTYLFNLCEAVQAPPQLVTLATCLVNDGLVYTNSSVAHSPLARACAALLVGMEALQQQRHERWVRGVAKGHALDSALEAYQQLLHRAP